MMKRLFILIFSIFALSVSVYATDLKGDIAQGGLVWGQLKHGAELRLDGEPVYVGKEGYFVFGFARDAAETATLVILHRDGRREERKLAVEQREFNIERVDGLPPKTVTPPESWTARRKVETGRVRKARAARAVTRLDWLKGFIKPAEGRFSGFYGSQRILNGKPRSPHYGLDIAGPVGTPVVAPAGGIITLAAPDFLLEGGIVIIDHGYGVSSTLFHMNSVDVKEGQRIEQGEPVGTIGSKGRSSGPHVDWRINWGSVRLDPLLTLEE